MLKNSSLNMTVGIQNFLCEKNGHAQLEENQRPLQVASVLKSLGNIFEREENLKLR